MVCDCGTPWTFLLFFFIYHGRKLNFVGFVTLCNLAAVVVVVFVVVVFHFSIAKDLLLNLYWKEFGTSLYDGTQVHW